MTRLAGLVSAPAAALAVLALCVPARARADSGAIACAVSSTPLMFGEYVPYDGASSDFTATLVVTCTTASAAAGRWGGTITLSGSGEPSRRQLRQGSQVLEYSLYMDPARTRAWGGRDGGAGLPISGVVSLAIPFRQTITVYGRIPAMQTSARVNRYSDEVAVTLQYEADPG